MSSKSNTEEIIDFIQRDPSTEEYDYNDEGWKRYFPEQFLLDNVMMLSDNVLNSIEEDFNKEFEGEKEFPENMEDLVKLIKSKKIKPDSLQDFMSSFLIIPFLKDEIMKTAMKMEKYETILKTYYSEYLSEIFQIPSEKEDELSEEQKQRIINLYKDEEMEKETINSGGPSSPIPRSSLDETIFKATEEKVDMSLLNEKLSKAKQEIINNKITNLMEKIKKDNMGKREIVTSSPQAIQENSEEIVKEIIRVHRLKNLELKSNLIKGLRNKMDSYKRETLTNIFETVSKQISLRGMEKDILLIFVSKGIMVEKIVEDVQIVKRILDYLNEWSIYCRSPDSNIEEIKYIAKVLGYDMEKQTNETICKRMKRVLKEVSQRLDINKDTGINGFGCKENEIDYLDGEEKKCKNIQEYNDFYFGGSKKVPDLNLLTRKTPRNVEFLRDYLNVRTARTYQNNK